MINADGRMTRHKMGLEDIKPVIGIGRRGKSDTVIEKINSAKTGSLRLIPIRMKREYTLTEVSTIVRRSRLTIANHIKKGLLHASANTPTARQYVLQEELRRYISVIHDEDVTLEALIKNASIATKPRMAKRIV
jgi:hypothetical protein